jgi:3-oxoacyl-[acyl-carrier-protein] synthase-3
MTQRMGIAAVASYLPERRRDAQWISQRSGLPVEVVRDHIGVHEVRIAADGEHPSDMAIAAARRAIDRAGTTADAIGLVVYTSAGFTDYQLWSPSAHLMAALGIDNGFGFEVRNNCAAANLAASIGAGIAERDPDVDAVLVVAADRMTDLVDYTDASQHLFFSFGDGASAAVLRRDEQSNRILGFAEHTVPTLNDGRVRWGGTTALGSTDSGALRPTIELPDPDDFTTRMSAIYLENYTAVVHRALDHADRTIGDVDAVIINQVKPSLRDAVLDTLGIDRSRTVTTITHFGHIGPADVWFCLEQALESGLVGPGSTVVLASSGLGASWAATVVEYA